MKVLIPVGGDIIVSGQWSSHPHTCTPSSTAISDSITVPRCFNQRLVSEFNRCASWLLHWCYFKMPLYFCVWQGLSQTLTSVFPVNIVLATETSPIFGQASPESWVLGYLNLALYWQVNQLKLRSKLWLAHKRHVSSSNLIRVVPYFTLGSRDQF